ncbi:MAG: SUMF1/EgtB/PvdO family nonheme iron enzyme [Gemmatimonadota bacterium]|nr:SUMF1/EgtB/PvdO family nonheme iron enzyme [Gemmatimonadota bacterium]MDE3005042.1 SUMF1/EgtB/PvdO family nonheme iron enzyme [Gemmatimonadota bacterium]
MDRILRFIREVHRRSVWQVLSVYVVASWGVLSGLDTISGILGLPDWFPSLAMGLMLVGLPIVLATAMVQDRPGEVESSAGTPASNADKSGRKAVLTWSRVGGGGVLALALWGAVALAWLLFAGARSSGAADEVLAAVAAVEQAVERTDWLEAFYAADRLPRRVPDSVRSELVAQVSRPVELTSEPVGATVSWRPYADPGADFEPLGTTPLSWAAPRTGTQYLFEQDGFAAQIVGDIGLAGPRTVHLRREDQPLAGAVHIAARNLSPAVVEARLANAVPASLDEFLIDRYEVTNAQFKEFLDAGGYEQQQYWNHPFELEDVELSWSAAMGQFVDKTGRQGPSGWEGGIFPEGQQDYPVTGVSWYEAAAYASFAGRQLPTVFHWFVAAGMASAQWTLPLSNMNGPGLAPVGQFDGISPSGVYDMAGNAREWLINATGRDRYTAGGGWNDPAWLFAMTQPQHPFDRSETNGFRLITNLGDAAEFSRISGQIEPVVRDFYAEEPASDELYAQLETFYRYEDLPLNAEVTSVDTLSDIARERVVFESGYSDKPMVLYLFRPLEAPFPLQTILTFPGSGALSGSPFGDYGVGSDLVTTLVRSGRAVAYPVYESTYERDDDYVYRLQDLSNAHRDHVLHWREDLGRSLDYLETRSDIDPSRFGYQGLSWGGRMAGIMLAVEPRFRAAVLNVAGLSPLPTQPVADPFNFLPRVTIPVLMLSGEYDATYPLETSARPFFDFLGTEEPDKRQFVAEGGHFIPVVDVTRETLDWFDRYLGEVRSR